ncbi:hypothetical protein [Hymenobacter glacialis]|nr:hypothetical protein [Hymenobacter glacialis]
MPGAAQPGPGLQAQVVALSGKGKGATFKLPQVALENRAVAELINRQLLRRIIAPNVDSPIDTMGTPAQQIRRAAALDCCFSGTNYTVLLNQGALLSLELTFEYHGTYYYERTDHITFDLNTGQVLALADVIADAPKTLSSRLRSAISRRISEELARATAEYGDSATVADLKQRFGWNAKTRQVVFARDARPAGAPEPSLTEFALSPHAVLLYYRVGLPPGLLNFTPNETYAFPWSGLRPRGPAQQLVPPVTAAPKR